MLFLLTVASIVCFSPYAFGGKLLKGKVYGRMELCQQPKVTVRRMDANETSKKDEFFHIDLSEVSSTVVQIEAECPPTEPGQLPLRATYSLNTAAIDWSGAHELLLFNDVSVLAFGYSMEQ